MFLYKFIRPILNIFISMYRPTIINKDIIPKKGGVILAGNHTSYLDPILVGKATKRCIRFFAKDSLYKGFKKPLFKALGIIPVNRKIKDKNSLNTGIKLLNENEIIGIFPEGTINKTNKIIMDFKYGAVKMSYETGKPIIPFAIKNKYILFKKNVKIIFGKPFIVKDNLEKENKLLMNKVKDLLKE